MKLLAARNDRLGDFMLAWPALQTLHLSLPEARLAVLAQAYTAPLARLCKGVDEVIEDPREDGELGNARALARLLRPSGFDAAVALFSRFDVALGLALARIPIRAAPATKLAQVFYTHRLKQQRSRSIKPEWVYNLELVEFFLRQLGVEQSVWAKPPYLTFTLSSLSENRRKLAQQFRVDATRAWAFIHPGHGGSSPTLPVDLFARIGRELAAAGALPIISEGPADAAAADALAGALGDVEHVRYRSEAGLDAYARDLAAADLFISGSTGPLHIAGALDVPTVGFYPHRRSASAQRWQTLNTDQRRLAFMPPPSAGEHDFSALDIGAVCGGIRAFLARVAPGRARAATSPRT
ncbi:MAG TPA: glycosyltransferase family 9 protein [Gammaproteobacteria bacterium]|nr:glycosyltransferase family 9 protein [Gammaproteobacteria bacterium]